MLFCRKNAFRLTKLSDCWSNIDNKLKRWHLSQHIGFVREHELILKRSGLQHDLASEQLQRLWICEKHRHDMNIHTISGSCPERTSVEQHHTYTSAGDVATGADPAKYFMAPNPRGKAFPFKPNLFLF